MPDIFTFISQHMGLAYSFVILFVILMIVEYLRLRRNNFRINPSQAVQLINRNNAVVIDIRANDLFSKGHIIDAVSMSTQDMQDTPKKLEKYRARALIIVCQTGVESQKTAALLMKQGYNVYALSGGVRAWNEAGMPLVKG